jgi:hypothetical protein
MFELERQKAKLASLNARAEKHGEENKPAADLTFTFDAPNDILSEFDPALKSSLYRKADASDPQIELSEVEGYAPKLRFPAMSGFKWDYEMLGGTITVHHGIGERSDLAMELAKADRFSFEPKDGGTVAVTFRVIVHPTEKQVGRLFGMIQEEVHVTLEPPEAADPTTSILGAP